jgi:hypothetical protein
MRRRDRLPGTPAQVGATAIVPTIARCSVGTPNCCDFDFE